MDSLDLVVQYLQNSGVNAVRHTDTILWVPMFDVRLMSKGPTGIRVLWANRHGNNKEYDLHHPNSLRDIMNHIAGPINR
jgi:hypothetical protein